MRTGCCRLGVWETTTCGVEDGPNATAGRASSWKMCAACSAGSRMYAAAIVNAALSPSCVHIRLGQDVAPTDETTPHADRGAGFRKVLAKLGIDLRSGEGAVAFMLFAFFAAAITFQYISKPVRQSVFIKTLGADRLPIVYLVLAVCAIPVILLYNRAVDRQQRHHVIAATCFVVACSVVGFSFVISSEAAWVPIAFYVWISIAYVMIVSQFWAYSNYVLNPRQGKRLFGFIGAGGPAGGLTGALLAGYIADVADTRTAVLVSAAILFAAIPLLYIIHSVAGSAGAVREERPRVDKLAQSKGGLEAIRGSRHLQLIAALMFVILWFAFPLTLTKPRQ